MLSTSGRPTETTPMRLCLLALALLAGQSREAELRDKLAPLFSVPDEYKGQLAPLRPLLDGVKTADDWKTRRAEILKRWNDLLGPWPPMVEKPLVQEQYKEE